MASIFPFSTKFDKLTSLKHVLSTTLFTLSPPFGTVVLFNQLAHFQKFGKLGIKDRLLQNIVKDSK
jgi:hypothetical protein